MTRIGPSHALAANPALTSPDAAALPVLTAVGLNVLRLGEWFLESSRAKTRLTPFARLLADTAAA